MFWDVINNYATFDRWYLGAFLVLFGIFYICYAKASNDLARLFPKDCDPAFAEAIKRRQELEALPYFIWRGAGVLFAGLGIVVLFGWMSGSLAYAISCTGYMALYAWALMGMRNTGPRRAALLEPRRYDAIIHPVLLVTGFVAALTPLAMSDIPQFRVSAILISLCALATIITAIRMNAMPAMMAGENPVAELEIERTLRCVRVKTAFNIAIGLPFVFVVFAHIIAPPTAWHSIAYLLTFAVFIVTIVPQTRFMTRLVWRRGKA